MSLTNKKLINPVEKYISYNATDGVFQYYDKVKGENVKIKNPITFTDIAQYSTIVGWNEEQKSTIFANEVLSLKTPLSVKFQKGGNLANGLYAEIKDNIKANGGKFAVSVYAILDKEIVKITLKGAALGGWFNKTGGDVITVDKFIEETKGATKYKVPVFQGKTITEEEETEIRENYKELFDYLESKDQSHNQNQESESNDTEREIPTIEVDEDIESEFKGEDVDIESVPF